MLWTLCRKLHCTASKLQGWYKLISRTAFLRDANPPTIRLRNTAKTSESPATAKFISDGIPGLGFELCWGIRPF